MEASLVRQLDRDGKDGASEVNAAVAGFQVSGDWHQTVKGHADGTVRVPGPGFGDRAV